MYLNQKALWNSVSVNATNNNYGDIQYGNNDNSIIIRVRRQEHIEEVRDKDGTLHHTNFIYYTYDDVKVDDRLDNNLVIDSYDMRTLGGRKCLRRLKTI